MKDKVNKSGPDKKEWLRELATGDALKYLANELASQFFKDARELKFWTPEQTSEFRNFLRNCGRWENCAPYPDASCRAGDVFVGLVMDTDREPDLSMASVYSEALIASQELERTLLVYITEHSCLDDNRWNREMRSYLNCGGNEDGGNEWLPTWPNFMIIDLENFQKEVTAPEGFFQQFLKILAESRTLEDARKNLDMAVEKRHQAISDEIVKENVQTC